MFRHFVEIGELKYQVRGWASFFYIGDHYCQDMVIEK